LNDRAAPPPLIARKQVRLEAENFRALDGYQVEDANDRTASHRLSVKSTGGAGASIRTPFNEPYAAADGRYDVDVRYRDESSGSSQFTLKINDIVQGSAWESAGKGAGWTTQTIRDVVIRAGDTISVQAEGTSSRLDYVQFNQR
jgi:hypothetical protein